MLFYWLRLFQGLAFYVKLVVETIVDLQNFMIIFLMLIVTFGNALYTLNQIPVYFDGDEDNPQYDLTWYPAFNIPFLDSVID